MKIVYEIAKVFDVEPFQAGEGDLFRFRLEVLRDLRTGRHTGRVYRLETYRLQPTFPQADGVLPAWAHDALVYVGDDMFAPRALTGDSVQDVVDEFERKLVDMFPSTRSSLE